MKQQEALHIIYMNTNIWIKSMCMALVSDLKLTNVLYKNIYFLLPQKHVSAEMLIWKQNTIDFLNLGTLQLYVLNSPYVLTCRATTDHRKAII